MYYLWRLKINNQRLAEQKGFTAATYMPVTALRKDEVLGSQLLTSNRTVSAMNPPCSAAFTTRPALGLEVEALSTTPAEMSTLETGVRSGTVGLVGLVDEVLILDEALVWDEVEGEVLVVEDSLPLLDEVVELVEVTEGELDDDKEFVVVVEGLLEPLVVSVVFSFSDGDHVTISTKAEPVIADELELEVVVEAKFVTEQPLVVEQVPYPRLVWGNKKEAVLAPDGVDTATVTSQELAVTVLVQEELLDCSLELLVELLFELSVDEGFEVAESVGSSFDPGGPGLGPPGGGGPEDPAGGTGFQPQQSPQDVEPLPEGQNIGTIQLLLESQRGPSQTQAGVGPIFPELVEVDLYVIRVVLSELVAVMT
ncbi:MAG: hypothetical protein Q9165_008469 [Trypethelium subeluteriae]